MNRRMALARLAGHFLAEDLVASLGTQGGNVPVEVLIDARHPR